MLIRFTVENFRSFDEEAVFSMIPGRMQKHAHHIIPKSEKGIDTLRLALLYGANASGKSNLIRAMDFAQTFIVEGTRPKESIPVEPFRLNKARAMQPSRFEFEFMADGQIYAYGFVVNRRQVHEEWLYVVNAQDETPLFERKFSKNDKAQVTFSNTIEERQFLDFVARGTRPNQLLLTQLAENNVGGVFEPVCEWFRHVLRIIFPESRYIGLELHVHEDKKFSHDLAAFLYKMNTGVDEVCLRPIALDSLDLPQHLMNEILSILDENDGEENGSTNEGRSVYFGFRGPDGQRYLFHRSKVDGSFQSFSLGTRRFVDEEAVDFNIVEESDGTKRLLDLFPLLYGTEERVFVIDELERSLHPNLVRRFIDNVLQSDTRNQLIVTTHESTLLDLTLLRRDEIWFVEKSPKGASTIYSLEAFKPRHDLDIRKGYLQGRFGAIPVFGSTLRPDYVEA